MANTRILGSGVETRIPPNYGPGHLRGRSRLGAQHNLLVQRASARYAELVVRGQMFIYSSAAAGIVLAVVTTTNQFGIWNPLGSGVIFVPYKFMIGVVSGAAGIAGTVAIYTKTDMGANIGTAAPISVWTDISPVNAKLGIRGSVPASRLRFATTNTVTTAPSLFRTMVFSQLQGRTGSANPPWMMAAAGFPASYVDEVSTPVLYPGCGMFLAANTAMALTCHITVIGAELPIPAQAV